MESKGKRCLQCGRRVPVTRRGLCLACYQRARRAVIAGKTTWKSLEDSGKAAPAVPYHLRSNGRRKKNKGPGE